MSGPVARQGVEGSMGYPGAPFVAQRDAQIVWDTSPSQFDRN